MPGETESFLNFFVVVVPVLEDNGLKTRDSYEECCLCVWKIIPLWKGRCSGALGKGGAASDNSDGSHL